MSAQRLLILLLCMSLCAACSEDSNCQVGQVLVDGVCVSDGDGDGVADSEDNCPGESNPDQADSDDDGIGDACEGVDLDADDDGVFDDEDNCPNDYNPDQADSDNDGIGDACEGADLDDDGVIDEEDNCPNVANPEQTDSDNDGIGDACEEAQGLGTVEDPIIIPVEGDRYVYIDARDTTEGPSDRFDAYPPDELDESGPEFVYMFDLDQEMSVNARIATPEPEGVDVDLHLLASVEPLTLLSRANDQFDEFLAPGRYYFIMDTFASDGAEMPGPYTLRMEFARQHNGTLTDPVPLDEPDTALPVPYVYTDSRDTSLAASDVFDSYPPDELDESGPEVIYSFSLDQPVRFTAELVCPEPDGVDIDVHLLGDIEPLDLIERSDKGVYAELTAGDYFLVLDTYAGGGAPRVGPYTLDVAVRHMEAPAEQSFRPYILAAVEWLYDGYGILGYASAVLTHDIAYGDLGTITATDPPRTMCVAATLEVILTAMQLYEDDTGDTGIWTYLPLRSFSRLGSNDLKAHIWVNHELNAGGTADALRHFGMGMTVPFEQMRPGDFINLNRTNGTGHAVTFLAFIDIAGLESDTWHENVVGFKYFSAQGGYDVGAGGLDYRYAVFSDFGSPEMPYNRDLNIIYSTNQVYLNTGTLYAPDYWLPTSRVPWSGTLAAGLDEDVSFFDPVYFDGRTTDDIE